MRVSTYWSISTQGIVLLLCVRKCFQTGGGWTRLDGWSSMTSCVYAELEALGVEQAGLLPVSAEEDGRHLCSLAVPDEGFLVSGVQWRSCTATHKTLSAPLTKAVDIRGTAHEHSRTKHVFSDCSCPSSRIFRAWHEWSEARAYDGGTRDSGSEAHVWAGNLGDPEAALNLGDADALILLAAILPPHVGDLLDQVNHLQIEACALAHASTGYAGRSTNLASLTMHLTCSS